MFFGNKLLYAFMIHVREVNINIMAYVLIEGTSIN
jgi:hypothetical protein